MENKRPAESTENSSLSRVEHTKIHVKNSREETTTASGTKKKKRKKKNKKKNGSDEGVASLKVKGQGSAGAAQTGGKQNAQDTESPTPPSNKHIGRAEGATPAQAGGLKRKQAAPATGSTTARGGDGENPWLADGGGAARGEGKGKKRQGRAAINVGEAAGILMPAAPSTGGPSTGDGAAGRLVADLDQEKLV